MVSNDEHYWLVVAQRVATHWPHGHLVIDHSPKCNEAKVSAIHDGPTFPGVKHKGAKKHIEHDQQETKVEWNSLSAGLLWIARALGGLIMLVGALIGHFLIEKALHAGQVFTMVV